MIIVSPHKWRAEWDPQSATWISWPHNTQTWPGRFEPVPPLFKRFISTVAEVQQVHILGGPNDSYALAEQFLSDVSNVYIHQIPTNDCWVRDYGPTFVTRKDDGSTVGICWKYNAWGGKYPSWEADAKAAMEVCSTLKCARSNSMLHCEGGALDTDGNGTLLSTRSCLLNPNRNPGWKEKMVEDELKLQLGVTKVIWVDGGGLEGDDTDGHIDQLARFVAPGMVVASTCTDVNDPNFRGLEENVQILRGSTDAEGRALQVHALPIPPARFINGQRVPESYCNFLLANEIVIVPTFRNQPTDDYAVDLFKQIYPSRKVIGMDAYDLIWGLGAFHCASQQQPR